MQETWRAFGSEMEDAVRSALDTSRSPPEIAYAIGGIVHNYFRTRGVTLTSYELRRLVAELLTLRQHAEPAPLVTFTAVPPADETSWTGDEPGTAGTGRARCRFRRPALAADRQGAARLRCRAAGRGDGQGPCASSRPCPRVVSRARPQRAAIDAALGAVLAGRARKAPAPGAAGLERTLRPRSARQDLGRPIDPRGVREWTRRHPCRAQWRARTIAGEISRPGASGGTRWSPGAAAVVGCRPVPLARRRGGHGDLSAGCPGGAGPGPAPRRAGQRDLRASDRRGHARSRRWPTCCASPRAAG